MPDNPQSPADLEALAGRVEQASGPDRYLDHAIHAAVYGNAGYCGDEGWLCGACSLPAHELTQEPGCGCPMGLSDERRSMPSDWRDDERLLPFSASLDAALTLYVSVPDRIPSNPRQATAEALRQRAEAGHA